MPEHDFLYLQKIYNWYGKKINGNVHLPNEGHDYSINKRITLFINFCKIFNLNISAIEDEREWEYR